MSSTAHTIRITKKGVKRRSNPKTIIKKAKHIQEREKFLKMSPEKQAEILLKKSLERRFIPRGQPVWSVPLPPLPATQEYVPPKKEYSKKAEYIGKVAGVATHILGDVLAHRFMTQSQRERYGKHIPTLVSPLAEMAHYETREALHTRGYGFLLHPNHPAYYRDDVNNTKGMPLNPIYKSLEMINAF